MVIKISGGYYLKARKIQDSEIAHAPPHVREMWDWLIKEATHTNGKSLKRGQCFTSYKEIIEGLSWHIGWRKMRYTKHQCEISMKWLKKRTMITTRKTTRGLVITILNYDIYQNPKNYENHRRTTTKPTGEPQTPDTIDKNDKNGRKKETDKELFQQFWKKYPNKVSKKSAYQEWKKVENLKSVMGKIMSSLDTQIKDKASKKGKGEFTPSWPHPERWIKREKWEDEISTEMPGVDPNLICRSCKKIVSPLRDGFCRKCGDW